MSKNTVAVSIGLPVYNGEKYIRQAIESALVQTFDDFELIISDNASTDSTEKICREYAGKDRRIRYYRADRNYGAAKNYNRVFELSRGKYFKWMASDDGMEPEFLKKAVEVLDRDKSIILVCSQYIQYNEFDKIVSLRFDAGNHDAVSAKASQRFRQALGEMGGNLPIFGLIRADILNQTSLIRPFIGSDDCLVLELVLKGKFLQLPEHLLRLRDHPDSYHWLKTSSVDAAGRRSQKEGAPEAKWFNPKNNSSVYLPFWKRLLEYLRVVIASDEKWTAKFSMIMFVFLFFARKRRGYLASEIIFAAGLGPAYIKLKNLLAKYFLITIGNR